MSDDELGHGAMDGDLLVALRELRDETRTRRHAYWMPLLVFGILVCAAAPLYMWTTGPSSGALTTYLFPPQRTPWLSALGGNETFWGRDSTAALRGWYWLIALLAGAGATAVWYSWYGRITGVATRVRASVLSWVVATLALAIVSATSLAGDIVTWPTTNWADAGLIVIALGLIVLCWQERSRLLTGITAAYCAAVAFCTFHDVPGMVCHFLAQRGLPDSREPYGTSGALVVLVPGLLLVLGAVITLRRDLRDR